MKASKFEMNTIDLENIQGGIGSPFIFKSIQSN